MYPWLCFLAFNFVHSSSQSYKGPEIGALDMEMEISMEETIETTNTRSGYTANQGLPEKTNGDEDIGNSNKKEKEKLMTNNNKPNNYSKNFVGSTLKPQQ